MKYEEIKAIRKLIADFNKTGRIAFLYPRKQRISISGSKAAGIGTAVKIMNEIITRCNTL